MIHDISGRPMIRLGGDVVHATKAYGDVISEFQWVDEQPCMVIYRAVPTVKTGAFVIEMDDAHQYAQSNGYPSAALVQHSMRAAEAIGLGGDRAAVFKMADVILDGVPILLGMPPSPPDVMKPNQLVSAIRDGMLSVQINGEQVL